MATKPKKSSAKKTTTKKSKKNLTIRARSAHEAEHLKQQISILESIHRSRKKLSPKARKVVGGIEADILKQMTAVHEGSVAVQSGTPSGIAWVAKYQGSNLTTELSDAFRACLEPFIAALKEAHASVIVSSTYRPVERAYLMHYAWLIAKKLIKAEAVPAKPGVDIAWVHATEEQSIQAAIEMVDGYDMQHIAALQSHHTQRRAVDMTIKWSGTLSIKDKTGVVKEIVTEPRDGMNADLHAVGKTYGVIKLVTDRPHWSDDGG